MPTISSSDIIVQSWKTSVANNFQGKEIIKYYIHDQEGYEWNLNFNVSDETYTYTHLAGEENYINYVFNSIDPQISLDFERTYSASEGDIDIYMLGDWYSPLELGLTYIDNNKTEVYWYAQDESNYIGYGELKDDDAYTLIHEIGHALGLDHPQLNGSDDAYGDWHDSNDTVMSYNYLTSTNAPDWREIDIKALQSIWGEENTTEDLSTSTSPAASSTELQQLYIAYFSRPCDPTGLDYWTNEGISRSAFAANMYLQPEFNNVNGGLSVEKQVNQIYLNLFNREADIAGLSYWTQQINLGNLQLASIANDLIWAAENNSGGFSDASTLANKTNAAVAYTAQIKTSTSSILDYQAQSTSPWITGSNLKEAKNFISGIGQYNTHTSSDINNSISKFSSLSNSSNYKLLIDPNQTKKDTITGIENNFHAANNYEVTNYEIDTYLTRSFNSYSLLDMNHQTFVSNLYEEVLLREPDSIGMNYWLGQLNSGAETQYEVLLGFSESAENKLLFTEMTGFG